MTNQPETLTKSTDLSFELAFLGAKCAEATRKSTAGWGDASRWLKQHLPTDGPPTSAETAIRDADVLATRKRTCGPTVFAILAAWDEVGAKYINPDRDGDLFGGFSEQDARRICLLAAMTFCRDFDGAPLDLACPWEDESHTDGRFHDRSWAMTIVTSWYDEERCHAVMEKALRYLELAGDDIRSLGSEAADDADYRPASAFPAKIRDRLRAAAQPNRPTKKVRTRGTGRETRYNVIDAKTWWPEDLRGMM